MIEAKEYDVVLTHSGIEATIVEKYESEPLYYAQRLDDDELITLKSDEIKKIIYKA